MSIRVRYEKELKDVFDSLVEMMRYVEEMIMEAGKSVFTYDKTLSTEVVGMDKVVNRYERDIENACFKILLMEQPVASDFRDISAVLKMITDLERIGDGARDIAEITLHTPIDSEGLVTSDIKLMIDKVTKMVHQGVSAMINKNLDVAKSLDKLDDEVDELFFRIKDDLVDLIRNDTKSADSAIWLLMMAKHLERIGDHAVNLGEWVEYSITGTRG